MAIEIRNPAEDELRAAMRAVEAAQAGASDNAELDRHVSMLPRDRFLAAYDDGRPVGGAASFPFELTIPGGTVRAGGVTWVGVLPTHRRRGILTQFMRRQLDELHAAGEPVAILWSAESAIYGRFGYGIAAPMVSIDARCDRVRFRDDPGPEGAVRLVTADESAELFPPVYERVRRATPGMLARSAEWWTQYKLADPESWRDGASPKSYAALELDGAIEGYATYRIKDDWQDELPCGELRVLEALATSPRATRELWRFLFSVDLIATVQLWRLDPGSGLFLMVEDPRRLRTRVYDGLWLRLVDVEAALRARSYAAEGAVVLELRDELCPWNAGRLRVGATVERTDDDADVALDVADLASAYLGGFDFHALAAADRARELRPGALARASALFRTERPPYCPEEF